MLRIVLFAWIALLPKQQDSPQQGGTAAQGAPGAVEGHVTNAQTGEPISGASVSLFPQMSRGGGAQPQRTVTQADGEFRVESLPPGSYFLVANDSSYASSGSGLVIKVDSGQQISNLAIQLQPMGAISGKVVDSDGNPAPGASVTVFGTYNWRGQQQLRATGSAAAGENGEYTVKNIAPGRYFVAAEPGSEKPAKGKEASGASEAQPPDNVYGLVSTFFPKSLSLDGATALDVAAGQNASGTVIQLQRAATHVVKGRVEAAVAPGPLLRATVSLAPRGALPFTGLAKTAKPEKDGSFAIDRVVAGNYTLWLTGSIEGESTARNRPARLQKLLARQELDVGAEDVSGIVLAVLPPIALTGRITLDGSPGANVNQTFANIRLTLVPGGDAPFGAFQSVNVNADGSFAVQSLDPGEYRVVVSNMPAGSYVHSVQYNRQDVTTTSIDLSGGGGGEVDVTLRMGAAEVDGTVEAGGEGAAGPGVAVLVPETLAPDGSGTLFGSVLTTGTFAIRNVPPGNYHALAIQRISGLWQNVDFLHEIEREGTPVEVQENGHMQVQVQMIPGQEIQQTATRLGLNAQ